MPLTPAPLCDRLSGNEWIQFSARDQRAAKNSNPDSITLHELTSRL
jgi:hypothetical protein